MIYFTSDTHYNHANIIEYSSRPFADLAEMEAAMISRWNSVVQPGDVVYHLGDFALSWGKKHADLVDNLLSCLNGQKHLIKGNHDRDEVTKNRRWVTVRDLHEIKVNLGGEHKQRIVLCHYALRTWPSLHRGAWMLHGHSHGSLSDYGGKILDVGVDVHDFRPISIEEVRLFMDSRSIVECDHHIPE